MAKKKRVPKFSLDEPCVPSFPGLVFKALIAEATDEDMYIRLQETGLMEDHSLLLLRSEPGLLCYTGNLGTIIAELKKLLEEGHDAAGYCDLGLLVGSGFSFVEHKATSAKEVEDAFCALIPKMLEGYIAQEKADGHLG